MLDIFDEMDKLKNESNDDSSDDSNVDLNDNSNDESVKEMLVSLTTTFSALFDSVKALSNELNELKNKGATENESKSDL